MYCKFFSISIEPYFPYVYEHLFYYFFMINITSESLRKEECLLKLKKGNNNIRSYKLEDGWRLKNLIKEGGIKD